MKFQHNKTWRWFVNRNIMTQKVDLYWMGEGVNGESYHRLFTEIKETVSEPGAIHSPGEPTLAIDYDQADTLMQEMWNAGIRPKGVNTGQSHVDSMKDHISSLQEMCRYFMETGMTLAEQGVEDTELLGPSPFDLLKKEVETLSKQFMALSLASELNQKAAKEPDKF